MRTAKTLISLGGCPSWFESSGAHAILLVLSWGSSICEINSYMSSNLSLSWLLSSIFSILIFDGSKCQNKEKATKTSENIQITTITWNLQITSENTQITCNLQIVNDGHVSVFCLSRCMTKPTKWPMHQVKTQIIVHSPSLIRVFIMHSVGS